MICAICGARHSRVGKQLSTFTISVMNLAIVKTARHHLGLRTLGASASALLIGLAGGVVGTSPAIAKPPVPAVATTGQQQEIAATGAEQCSVPVAIRVGAWICLEPKTRAITAVPLPPPPKGSTHCNSFVCWTRISSAQSEFDGGGPYGFGNTTLGRVQVYAKITMNGAQSVSSPVRFTSTRGVRNLTIEGDRLYISSAHPEGNAVSPSVWAHYGPVSAAAGSQVTWKPNGYKSRETTVAWASIVHNFVWQDPSSNYPGRWYFYVKSNKLKRQSSGVYAFEAADSLPTQPSGQGWTRNEEPNR